MTNPQVSLRELVAQSAAEMPIAAPLNRFTAAHRHDFVLGADDILRCTCGAWESP